MGSLSAEVRVPRRLIRAEILLVIESLAFWPVWRWYIHRLGDRSDEAWGIVALVTAVLFAFRVSLERIANQCRGRPVCLPRIGTTGDYRGRHAGLSLPYTQSQPAPGSGLWLPAVLLICY